MSRCKIASRRGAGRVAYLALRPQIEEALAAGHHVATIFAQHAAHLPISYKQFAKYVQRYSDDRKVRPVGWTLPVKRPRPPKAPDPAPTKPPPSPPTKPWKSDLFLDRPDDESLF